MVFRGQHVSHSNDSTMFPLHWSRHDSTWSRQHGRTLVPEPALGVPQVQSHFLIRTVSGLRTYQRPEPHSLVDHQREKEVWNATGTHHSSGWKGTDRGWNESSISGQEGNNTEMTRVVLNTTGDTTRHGSVVMVDTRRHHLGSALKQNAGVGRGDGAILNFGPKSNFVGVEQNREVELKYHNLRRSHDPVVSSRSGQTGFHATTSPRGRLRGVAYLPQPEKAVNQSTPTRCARSEVQLTATEALSWMLA